MRGNDARRIHGRSSGFVLDRYWLRLGGLDETVAPSLSRTRCISAMSPISSLALQLPFRFEVRSLSGSLVSSAPARPCDDACGLNTLSSESDGNAADFLD